MLSCRPQILKQNEEEKEKINKSTSPDFQKQRNLSELEQTKRMYERWFHYVFRGAFLTYSRCFDYGNDGQRKNAEKMLGEAYAKKWKEGEWIGRDDYKLVHKRLLQIRDEAIRHAGSNWGYSIPLLHEEQTVCFVDIEMSYGLDFFDELANILSNLCPMALKAIKTYSAEIEKRSQVILDR